MFFNGKPIFVIIDASQVGLGAIFLQQQDDEEKKPVAYISKTLSEVERRYSQIEREALAIVWAENFTSTNTTFNLEIIQPCKYEIRHVARRNNIADSISRLPAGDRETSCLSEFCDEYVRFVMETNNADLGVISLSDIRRETKKDSALSKICECVKSGNWLAYAKDKQVMLLRNEISVHEDILLRGNRIVLPLSLQNDILKLAHETHMGIVKAKQLLRQMFYGPLNANVPLQNVALPEGPWKGCAVDIVGPIDDKYIVTYIDYYSSYPEAVVVTDISSQNIIRVLSSIFYRFGYPEEIVSDNGKQFVSSKFQIFLKSCSIKHVRCSPYYPRSNGKIERFHRYLKKNLKSVVAKGKSWEDSMSQILMAYRFTPHSGSGESPVKLMFGREIRAKLRKLIWNVEMACIRAYKFNVGDKVFIVNRAQGKLGSKFSDIPYAIKER
ncbi:Transposon Tf2-9 poly, partial [Paramuricea clavata]